MKRIEVSFVCVCVCFSKSRFLLIDLALGVCQPPFLMQSTNKLINICLSGHLFISFLGSDAFTAEAWLHVDRAHNVQMGQIKGELVLVGQSQHSGMHEHWCSCRCCTNDILYDFYGALTCGASSPFLGLGISAQYQKKTKQLTGADWASRFSVFKDITESH